MIVTFCGHADIPADMIGAVKEKVRDIAERLIIEGATEFLLGGYGKFDYICAKVIRELKAKYPDVKSILVIPYIGREYDKNLYDGSWYPPIETVPKRFAISKRNEYMVKKADALVCCVNHSWGGAAQTLKYALRKNKQIMYVRTAK